MPVQCKICNREFSKLLTSSHLANHQMKSADYIKLYGKDSLASPEYRNERSMKNSGINNPNYGNIYSSETKKLISEKTQGRIPHNKGKKLDDTTAYRNAAAIREEKYITGELLRSPIIMTEEIKKKISEGVVRYAENNKDELSARAKKSLKTKIDNGIDLAFFRGKTHSEESKALISEKSKLTAEKKYNSSIEYAKKIIIDNGYRFVRSDKKYITIGCNKCNNIFEYTRQMFTDSKIRDDFCNICNPPLTNTSIGEQELYEFIKSICPDAINRYRFDGKKEIDIYIPSKNIGIEYNGLYWHSQSVLENTGQLKTKDFEKLMLIEKLGIRPIFIYEDEWKNKNTIVKNRLKHILGFSNNVIYARKCVVKEVDSKSAAIFSDMYHIQGRGRSNVRLGLYHNDTLVSLMTFSNNNISRKIAGWELNRFCSINDTSIPGAASKLFNYFLRTYNPSSIITYADRRWSIGNLYKKIGFTFSSYTNPGYWYVRSNQLIRLHRYNLRKTKNDPVDITEYALRKAEGYDRIYDCGNSKWIWNRYNQ